MSQFSIKNEKAVKLLEVTAFTGEGKTDAVVQALELYRDQLLASPSAEVAVESIRRKVHARIDPDKLGRAPSKAEIEAELGMP